MRFLKIFFKTSYWLIIVTLVLIASLTSLSVIKNPFGVKLLSVQSGSMEPSIKTGSVVIVKNQDTYGLGDIITFTDNPQNDSTTHRIIKSEVKDGKEIYTTKGDANQGDDRLTTTSEKILGKVIFDVPYLGYPVSFAKTQYGFIFLIVVPATIIIFSEVLNLKKEILKLIKKKKRFNTNK